MTVIQASITMLCCSLFSAALIKLLAPSGKTEKVLKLIISLFLLICITNCIRNVMGEMKLLKEHNADYTEKSETINRAVNEDVLKVTGNYMVSYIENLLISQTIEFNEIAVTVDSDTKGVINITDICIYMDKRNSDAQKASAIIEEDLKITPRLIFEE